MSTAVICEQQHRLRLELFERVRDLILPMPATTWSVTALLPSARTIVHAVADAAAQAALEKGKKVSCGPGCGACCRQLVPISVVEASSLVTASTQDRLRTSSASAGVSPRLFTGWKRSACSIQAHPAPARTARLRPGQLVIVARCE